MPKCDGVDKLCKAIATVKLLAYTNPEHTCEETARQFLDIYFPSLVPADCKFGNAFTSNFLASNRDYLVQFNMAKIKLAITEAIDAFRSLNAQSCSWQSMTSYCEVMDGATRQIFANLVSEIKNRRMRLSKEQFFTWAFGCGPTYTIGNGAPYEVVDDLIAMLQHHDIINDREALTTNTTGRQPHAAQVVSPNIAFAEFTSLMTAALDAFSLKTLHQQFTCPTVLKILAKYLKLLGMIYTPVLERDPTTYIQACPSALKATTINYLQNLDPMDVLLAASPTRIDAFHRYLNNTSDAALARSSMRPLDNDSFHAVQQYVALCLVNACQSEDR